jgi:hypothetical protein
MTAAGGTAIGGWVRYVTRYGIWTYVRRTGVLRSIRRHTAGEEET